MFTSDVLSIVQLIALLINKLTHTYMQLLKNEPTHTGGPKANKVKRSGGERSCSRGQYRSSGACSCLWVVDFKQSLITKDLTPINRYDDFILAHVNLFNYFLPP